MNILQLVNALTWGGAQILVADLARAARTAGHAVVIAAFRDGPVGSQLRQEGFDVRILGEEAFDLVAAWRLLRLWREFRPDVIHSHLSRATFWARFLRHRAPRAALVTTIHGFESGSFHIVEKRMASLSDHLVFPSAFLEHWYGTQIRNLPAGRSSVLYPGVEITAPSQRTFDTRSPSIENVMSAMRDSPPINSEKSAEVPPMSKVTRSGTFACRQTSVPATTPPAGPDRSIVDGLARAARTVETPPSLRISRIGTVSPIAGRSVSSRRI